MYTYKATVLKVVDGDTVDLMIDCGFEIFAHTRVRLAGIDAPEVRGAEKAAGKAAKAALVDMLYVVDDLELFSRSLIVKTGKKGSKGKYGRWIAWIWLEEEFDEDRPLTWDETSINGQLVKAGHAVWNKD